MKNRDEYAVLLSADHVVVVLSLSTARISLLWAIAVPPFAACGCVPETGFDYSGFLGEYKGKWESLISPNKLNGT
ncbi:MAG: hypothetical protein ACLS43_05350 [Evtepia gabavorous]